MLEVIDKGACSQAHPVPLLFVHGGWHAAWCWDAHFLDFFADRGFRAVAVSWRGHGGSDLTQRLRSCSIADYLDDVCTAVDALGGPAVVIGHSTGGFVVQKYLETRSPPAAVLMASVPPQGILRASFRIWRNHPWASIRANAVGNSVDLVNTPTLGREHLFSPYTPESIVDACIVRLEPESMRAAFLDQLTRLPKPAAITTPMLVLGGEDDGTITTAEVRATARAYRTEAELFPRMGHNMMLEPDWARVAQRIAQWLVGRGL